jgi:hypothetical protein
MGSWRSGMRIVVKAGLTPPEDLTYHCHQHSAMLKIRMAGHAARRAAVADVSKALNKAAANIRFAFVTMPLTHA